MKRYRPRVSKARGFTFIELTVVVIVVGILAVIAVGKLTSTEGFAAQGYFETAKAATRFAQKTAVAQRSVVVVVVNPTSINLCYTDAGCASPVIDPTTGSPMSLAAPGGVSISGPSQSFDGLGTATPGGVIGITGDGVTRNLTIEAQTGYVYD